MNPQAAQRPQIDMGAVRAALQQRAAGGGGAPVAGQVAAVRGGGSPIQGAPTPMQRPSVSQIPNVGRQAPAGGANPAQQTAKAAAVAQGPAFDPETRDISKALIQKLLKVM